jgi:hypothetical protein
LFSQLFSQLFSWMLLRTGTRPDFPRPALQHFGNQLGQGLHQEEIGIEGGSRIAAPASA